MPRTRKKDYLPPKVRPRDWREMVDTSSFPEESREEALRILNHSSTEDFVRWLMYLNEGKQFVSFASDGGKMMLDSEPGEEIDPGNGIDLCGLIQDCISWTGPEPPPQEVVEELRREYEQATPEEIARRIGKQRAAIYGKSDNLRHPDWPKGNMVRTYLFNVMADTASNLSKPKDLGRKEKQREKFLAHLLRDRLRKRFDKKEGEESFLEPIAALLTAALKRKITPETVKKMLAPLSRKG